MEDFYTIDKTFGELEHSAVFKLDGQLWIKRSKTSAHKPYGKCITPFADDTKVKIHSKQS
jgi:hypothetical protein